MKNKVCAALAALLLMVGGTTTAQAASQDECAIWLCLPGGFPSGCSSAASAMRDRLRDFKPPLPSFSSCAVSGNVHIPGGGSVQGSQMTHEYGYATYISSYEVCGSWVESGPPKNRTRRCTQWNTVPGHYEKGRCWVDRDGNHDPEHCVPNHGLRYVEVYMDGQLTGPTHWFEL